MCKLDYTKHYRKVVFNIFNSIFNILFILVLFYLLLLLIYKTSIKSNLSEFYFDKDWLHSTKLTQMGFAFLWIPAIIVLVIICVSNLYHVNILNIIPSEDFALLTNCATNIKTVQTALYLYYKILMNGQTAIIGLIGIEVVKLDKERKNNAKGNSSNKSLPDDLAKYTKFYNKFHKKSLDTNSKFLKKVCELIAYKIIWNQWLFIFLFYATMTFAFGTKLFD